MKNWTIEMVLEGVTIMYLIEIYAFKKFKCLKVNVKIKLASFMKKHKRALGGKKDLRF